MITPFTSACGMVSIRAPVSRPGRPGNSGNSSATNFVSIRAPVSRPGRHMERLRESASGGVSIRAPVSRPGRHDHSSIVGDAAVVSIRAPVSRPGRPSKPGCGQPPARFQSAPRSRDRGDRPRRSKPWPGCCFNPRPGLATGATGASGFTAAGDLVSIRAPVSRPGRRVHPMAATGFVPVSIRAPVSRPGRLVRHIIGMHPYRFNPRPGLATGATPST